MNIFNSLRIYILRSFKLYESLKLWRESVSSDLNDYSWTCYPNGLRGFSFGDRLDAVIYITLAYLHRKIFYEECLDDQILPIPGIDNDYWQRIIDTSLKALECPSRNSSEYNQIISELFNAVYDYSEWYSFIACMISNYEGEDEETVKAFSFMFSKYLKYSNIYRYENINLNNDEINYLNKSKIYKFGLFDYILPPSVEENYDYEDFLDKLYMRLYIPVYDKNNKYKHGDIVSVDENCQSRICDDDVCLILQ